MELRSVGETLDRLDRLALGLDRERGARAHGPTVEQDRARATDLRVAAQLRADESETAHELDEQHLILDLEAALDAVQAKLYLASAHRYDACARSESTARCANTPTRWRLYSTEPARSAVGSTA